MGSLSQAETAQLKAQLRDAVTSCADRGLYQAAKWYARPRPHGD
jgi:anaphase-promoting complex subunit 8